MPSRSRVLVGLVICISSLLASDFLHAQTPEQRFWDWSSLQFSPEVYSSRRERLAEMLTRSGGGLMIVPSRQGVSDGFSFRQTDDFVYLTGLELPDSVLILYADNPNRSNNPSARIYAPRRDARFESASRRNDFPGRPLADDLTISQRAAVPISPIAELDAEIDRAVRDKTSIRLNLGQPGEAGVVQPVVSDFVNRWSDAQALQFHLEAQYSGLNLKNGYEAMARLRMVHGPEEIEAMRRVCNLTIRAIRHAAGFIRAGIDERGLEAELEAEYKRGGAQRLAFASIIKSGPNALWPWRILAAHVDRRNRKMENGDLVIFDVGTELNHYVSDVGRTFPVSGKFNAEQRRTLEMQLAVSDAIIAAIKPGVRFEDLKRVAVAATPEAERPYMQAGGFFGHHIGLSSGDPSLTDEPLKSGMIFTVEPWYYNHDTGISVFVEDVLLVTENGAENLTKALPRTANELEAMVAESNKR